MRAGKDVTRTGHAGRAKQAKRCNTASNMQAEAKHADKGRTFTTRQMRASTACTQHREALEGRVQANPRRSWLTVRKDAKAWIREVN